MATKLKAIIPPLAISQCPAFTNRDDGQQLIRKSVHKSTSSRPRFSIRSKKSKCKKSKKVKKADQTQRSTQQSPAWNAFDQSDPASENGKRLKTKKKRISLKIVRKAGQRIEWLLKKGAKYFGIAVIKIFNQPGLYTEESRSCVC